MKVRKIKGILVLIAVFVICIIIIIVVGLRCKKGQRIQWHDQALEMEVKRNMHYYGDIYSGGLEYWPSTLEIIGENIRGLEDLRQFSGTERLYLRATSVTDLSPLESLTNLKVLIIDGGKVQDLEPLSDMKSLAYVALNNLPVTSIQPLTALDDLETLSISGLKIEKLPLWRDHNNISWMDLKNLPLTSVDEIQNMKKLYHIDIENTEVEDVSVLNVFPELVDISLYGKSIKTISDLSNLADLRSININSTSIEKLPKLPSKLDGLYLNNNLMSDYHMESSLNTLSNLQISNIPQNSNLRKMNVKKMCPNLRKLNLSGDNLQSITENDLPKSIIELDVSNNPMNELTGLDELPELKKLNLSGIRLKDTQILEILSGMNLISLSASSCELNNLEFMNGSPDMEELYVSHNNIRDINEIKALNSLSTLDISYNPIVDVTPLRGKQMVNLNVSGIDLMAAKDQGEYQLQLIVTGALSAAYCNLDNLELIQHWARYIDVSDNHIRNISFIRDQSGFVEYLDASENPITEKDVEEQLGAREVYPGVYFGPREGDLPYYQVKLNADSEFLEKITNLYP